MVLKLIKSMVEAITRPIQHLIITYLRSLFGFPSVTHHDHVQDDHVKFLIEDSTEVEKNKLIYDSTRVYLFSKTNFELCVGGYKCDDQYQGVKLKWTILVDKTNFWKKSFELRFDEKHRGLVFDSYIPYVESKAKEIKSMKRTLYMHTFSQWSDDVNWETKSLDHRSTFETIFMKEEVKHGLTHDLDRFITRKDFYTRVGRPWTINYLVHGLPGTGKTSLVAAMANYLNSDVYNLPLKQVVKSDFDPRRLPLEVMDGSIILVEDIDCSLEGSTFALSQLLRSLGGLYSIDGGVVIFTTNNIERLDKRLLSRMHRDIYMGHCCFKGFKTLASNYLDLSDDNHRLYPHIKRLIDGQVVTPGQVAEELMKSQDVDVALEGLVRTLEMIKRV
ncbi:unnamed protein product [Arabis nemorensis]|uniref:Uncharacterized protein n=1 Tax=Arabis nemorensis TaxID=586526 RepID=A0A565BGA0_9BRAS|nr:unnamed protein product [Arabis nemorensis]